MVKALDCSGWETLRLATVADIACQLVLCTRCDRVGDLESSWSLVSSLCPKLILHRVALDLAAPILFRPASSTQMNTSRNRFSAHDQGVSQDLR